MKSRNPSEHPQTLARSANRHREGWSGFLQLAGQADDLGINDVFGFAHGQVAETIKFFKLEIHKNIKDVNISKYS